MRLGDVIRHEYRAAGLKQTDLAAACGIGQSTISEWVNNRKEPTLSNIAALEAALSLDRGTLLRESGWLPNGSEPSVAEASDSRGGEGGAGARLAKAIREAKGVSGLSQTEIGERVARVLGRRRPFPQTVVGAWLRDDGTTPDIEQLLALDEVFDFDAGELLRRAGMLNGPSTVPNIDALGGRVAQALCEMPGVKRVSTWGVCADAVWLYWPTIWASCHRRPGSCARRARSGCGTASAERSSRSTGRTWRFSGWLRSGKSCEASWPVSAMAGTTSRPTRFIAKPTTACGGGYRMVPPTGLGISGSRCLRLRLRPSTARSRAMHTIPAPEGMPATAWPTPFGRRSHPVCLYCSKALRRSGYWYVHSGSGVSECYPVKALAAVTQQDENGDHDGEA